MGPAGSRSCSRRELNKFPLWRADISAPLRTIFGCFCMHFLNFFFIFLSLTFLVFVSSRILPGNLIFLIIILLVASDSWAVAKWWRWQVLPVFWWHRNGSFVRVFAFTSWRFAIACHTSQGDMRKWDSFFFPSFFVLLYLDFREINYTYALFCCCHCYAVGHLTMNCDNDILTTYLKFLTKPREPQPRKRLRIKSEYQRTALSANRSFSTNEGQAVI